MFPEKPNRKNHAELILWKSTWVAVVERATVGSGNCKGVRHEATLRWSCAMKLNSAIELVAGKVDLVGID